MPYCPNCGKETVPGSIYCHSCGRPLQASQTPSYAQASYYSKKEEAIAAILSLIIPGVGQMYVGRIVRGIVILVTPIAFGFLVVIPILLASFFASVPNPVTRPFQPPGITQPTFILAFPVIFIVLGLLWLAFLLWNVFDAYNLARVYNHHLMTTGRPPW